MSTAPHWQVTSAARSHSASNPVHWRGGRLRVEATAFFGGFPHDRRAIQLAVRTADGTVHRFGPIVPGGPEAGFHSPRITDPDEAARLAGGRPQVRLRRLQVFTGGVRPESLQVP